MRATRGSAARYIKANSSRKGSRPFFSGPQGKTIEEARDNLREALELFLESASPTEIKQRLRDEVFVTQIEVAIG